MNVVSLSDEREKREPHWAGPVKCIGCGHEHVAVAPMGTMFLECPSCNELKAHPKYAFGAPEGASLFLCNCGSEALTAYFYKGRFKIMCMACGADHAEAILGAS